MRTLSYFSRAILTTTTLIAGSAFAGFTKIDGPITDQPSQAQILSQIYGGAFSGNGDTYSNGAVTARRIEDTGSADTDQVWKPGEYTIRSLAKFTSEESRFYASNPTHPQLTANGVGYSRSLPVTINAPEDFNWNAINYYGSSSTDVSLNDDGKDHFLTYEIQDGGTSGSKFVLFWEDLPQTRTVTKSDASWSDFNDLVVEVQAAPTNGAVIPLPPAVYAGGATLVLLAGIQTMRSRVRHA